MLPTNPFIAPRRRGLDPIEVAALALCLFWVGAGAAAAMLFGVM